MRMKGDVLEAFFGALFLDVGFNAARRAFVDGVLRNNIDFAEVEAHSVDPKSLVYIWARKQGVSVQLDVCTDPNDSSRFLARVFVDGVLRGKGVGVRKKLAEQEACAQMCHELLIEEDY